MDFKKIGIILGGPSAEREISISTGHAISGALRARGHSVIEIGEKGSIEEEVVKQSIDIAFIALHGSYGEDGTIQTFLEKNNILYTGSDPVSSRNAMDKIISKAVFIKNKIPTPKYIVLNSVNEGMGSSIEKKLGFPVVVKPKDNGSSIGLNIVQQERNLKIAVEEAFKYSEEIIIEKYIDGKEVTVGILGNAGLPVIEIIPHEGHYSYKAKYTRGLTEYVVPAKLTSSVYSNIQYTGLKAHNVLGCRDFSRVDMRLDKNGIPWVLEVNTIPGFTETSLLPKAAKAVGIEFGELCERIIDMAYKRKKVKGINTIYSL